MTLITQTTPDLCGAASLSMLLEVPVKTILQKIGYEGGVIHMQRLYLAAAGMGAYFMPLERKPILWDGRTETRVAFRGGWLHKIMEGRKGLITGYTSSGSGHCVAFDGVEIFDPVGLTYLYRYSKTYNFRPDTFHLMIRSGKVA